MSAADPSSSLPTSSGVDRRTSVPPLVWSAQNVVDRRSGIACRREAAAKLAGKSSPPLPATIDDTASWDRRRGAGRRLSDFNRSAEEGDFNKEQLLFVMAIDAFKRANDKAFPAWTDVLEVIRLLGYRKTCDSELEVRNAEDWKERADAPSRIRPRHWENRAA